MRIAEYKQVDTKIETNVIMVDDYNEDGEVVGQHEETVTREVPVMGMVYRDATPEEEAEAEAERQRMEEMEANREPTVEEQLADLSDYVDVLTEMLMGGIDDGD